MSSLLTQDTAKKTGQRKGGLLYGVLGGGMLLASIAGVTYYAGYLAAQTSMKEAEAVQEAPAMWGLSSMVALNDENYGKTLFANGLKLECQKYMASGQTNDWHIVKFTTTDFKTFKWTNKAGVSWSLYPASFDATGQPTTFNVGEDCPYYKQGYKVAKAIYGPNRNLLGLTGPGDEPYQYVIDWSLPDKQLDMPNVWQNGLLFECSQYIKAGNPNDWHYVKISNPSNDGVHFQWENKAGVKWSLAPQMSGDRLTQFQVGQNCPYWKSGHKVAPLYYTTRGNLVNVKGPGGEVYTHVINFTP